jgi:hypothetical protein
MAREGVFPPAAKKAARSSLVASELNRTRLLEKCSVYVSAVPAAVSLTPHQCISRWQAAKLTESSGSQRHFNGLCSLLDVQIPRKADPTGGFYTAKRDTRKTDGQDSWAEVWVRGCFAWKHKSLSGDLNATVRQCHVAGS